MGVETVVVVGAVVAAAAAAAGAGVAYYGQQQQAKNATRIANYNAAVQQQQADMQSRMAVRQAEINNSFLQTQRTQSYAVDNQATAIRSQADEEVKRNNERRARMMATQRAGYAKAGVVMAGSPLEVLAETAGLFELQNQDIQFEAESKATALEREAALRRAGLASDIGIQDLNASAAKASRGIGYANAAITRMQGAASAQGYKTASYGSLLSGVGSAAGSLSAVA